MENYTKIISDRYNVSEEVQMVSRQIPEAETLLEELRSGGKSLLVLEVWVIPRKFPGAPESLRKMLEGS